jgi:hypothetical protein
LAQGRAHLECTGGPEKGQTFRVAPGITTLGRDPACEVALSEPAISRHHCRIERRGDDWVLVNLSSNGTRLAKKNIDEAVLADRSEIRLGAKTHLVFVIETVAPVAAGRPQFRARTGQVEPPAAEEPQAAQPEAPVSLFQRRKKLFIGLGAYFAVMILLLLAGLLFSGPGDGRREVPVLGIEDELRLATGERLEIIRDDPDGYWVRDPVGRERKVLREEITAGRARRIPGMRHAIEQKFQEPVPNRMRADALKSEALELYDRREAAPENLFLAVRKFQRALAYYGPRSFFVEPVVDNIYKAAAAELLDTVQREYTQAVLFEKTGDHRKADQTFRHLLAMIPVRDNLITRNVLQHLDAIQPYLREEEEE